MRSAIALYLSLSVIVILSACGAKISGTDKELIAGVRGDDLASHQSDNDAPALTTKKNIIPRDWVRVDFPGFSFSMPTDLNERDIAGIDSFVKSYRGKSMILTFDYGDYSPREQNPTELIGGKAAAVHQDERMSEIDGVSYGVLSYVQFVDIEQNGATFVMSVDGQTDIDRVTAEVMFRSIQCK